MKVNRLYLVVLVALLALLVACTPKAAPAPVPAPVPVAPPTAPVVTPAGPTLSPEEVAWQKVVEAAKKEGKLTIYSFNFTGVPAQKIARAFQDQYGIQIEYVGGFGSVLIERIKSEHAAKKNIADILEGAVSNAVLVKQTGFSESAGQLPVLREEKVWKTAPQQDAEGHIFTWGVSTLTPVINTELVRQGNEPKTYKELVEPKWKGKMVVGTPSTTPAFVYLWVMREKLGLGEEWFRQLAKNDIKFVLSIRETVQEVASGGRAVLPSGSPYTFAEFINRGAQVKAVAVEEGMLTQPSIGINIVKSAPHPQAARLFLNWLLSSQGQRVVAEAVGTIPVRADVKDFMPPAAQIEPKRVVPMTIADITETSKVQREKTLEKIFGLE